MLSILPPKWPKMADFDTWSNSTRRANVTANRVWVTAWKQNGKIKDYFHRPNQAPLLWQPSSPKQGDASDSSILIKVFPWDRISREKVRQLQECSAAISGEMKFFRKSKSQLRMSKQRIVHFKIRHREYFDWFCWLIHFETLSKSKEH